MRRKFGKLIDELAYKDKKIILLVGDIGYGIFDDFRTTVINAIVKNTRKNAKKRKKCLVK